MTSTAGMREAIINLGKPRIVTVTATSETTRKTIIRKSDYTNLELGQQVRERDETPTFDRISCGCAWKSGKGGTSIWEHTAACGPWPAAYPSKRKYRRDR